MKNLEEIEIFAEQNFVPILKEDSRDFLLSCLNENQPTQILEIGTAIGYSGCLILSELKNSYLTTIEILENRFELARQNFTDLGFSDRVTQILGDATEVLKMINQKFDFVFLDGPKSHYVRQFPYLLEILNKNGIIFVDNVLFRGMVKSEEEPPRRFRSLVRNLRKFLLEVESNKTVESEILEVGDGIMIIKKIT